MNLIKKYNVQTLINIHGNIQDILKESEHYRDSFKLLKYGTLIYEKIINNNRDKHNNGSLHSYKLY